MTATRETKAASAVGQVRQGGALGLIAVSAVTEVRSKLRTPEFAVGAIAIPVLLYAMFGLPNAGVLPGGTTVRTAFVVSMAAYGVISLAIFTFGEDVAKDRGQGWLRTLRATPVPVWTYLVGKVASAVVLAALIVAAIGVLAATAGGVRLDAGTWVALAALMIAGVLLFAPLGFAIAFLVRPRAAAVISNLIFLPLAFASGFFMPLSELPEVLGDIARYLPTFHYGQLAYAVVMPAEDITYWTGVATSPAWVHLLWVFGSAVVLGAAALIAARREAVTARG
ncbi:ABC transporter permease [Occultella glacieicola]|uniref:Transport permease protein n=1 Tax=Occultella glacieicola TaxID=2518684 RepID=A0ABY2EAB0_9MICO|nr:ABC transporter permease [Occultella glacieicola]TDE95800.1 ABC transporter permease [Occultella glacieicola]